MIVYNYRLPNLYEHIIGQLLIILCTCYWSIVIGNGWHYNVPDSFSLLVSLAVPLWLSFWGIVTWRPPAESTVFDDVAVHVRSIRSSSCISLLALLSQAYIYTWFRNTDRDLMATRPRNDYFPPLYHRGATYLIDHRTTASPQFT